MYNLLKGRLISVRLILLAATFALVAIGIATIYSVGHPAEPSPASQTEDLSNLWKKQLLFAAVSVIGFLAVNMINYRRLGIVSYWIYALMLVLLSILLLDKIINIRLGNVVFIPVINGARRWIKISIAGQSFALQPSEVCKLAYVLALAWYLRYRSNYRNFKGLIGPFILTVLPMTLILLEPDLGTTMLMMPIFLVMLFVAGAKVKHLLIMVVLAILVSPLLWNKMKPYQRIRISSVVLQNAWVREKVEKHLWLGNVLVGTKFSEKQWKSDWGWHLIRSKYAVASGGAKGYGFRQGPFVKYDFLEHRQNDFIFAIIAHQWGIWGCLVVLGLYAIIVCCGVEIAGNNTDPFGRLLAVGIVAMFTVEVLVNVSMTLGLMPITGLTLPFVSYGGSSLLVSMTSIGLLNNVGRCRPFSLARKT